MSDSLPPRGPRYPLTVRFDRGRVRHLARETANGGIATACRKRGRVLAGVSDLPMCAACMARPNPQDCRSYPNRGSDA